MTRNILVTGGAGYIGSHMVKMLAKNGVRPIVVDNLSNGHPNKIVGGEFIQGDVEDEALISRIVKDYAIEAVMHFAAFIRVEESVADPAKYYRNNTINTVRLLNTLAASGVKYFIFSSTAAIFGEPAYLPADENHPIRPLNPYGRSKYLIEQLLPDYERAYGLKFGCLRYFNAAGADAEGELGQLNQPRTHLISVALDAAMGKHKSLTVFGSDYPTADGSCVRDYIHIQDLCSAHLLLLDYLKKGGEERFFNLGTGNGYSVLEVLECARAVTGKAIPATLGNRRPGDSAALVADSKKARALLGWSPTRSELKTIIEDAWRWEQRK